MTGGDVNELSNQKNIEIIRLTAPSGKDWSNIWVSSLDTGGTGGNETGTVFWSNSSNPNLSTLATFTTFSHTSTGFGSSVEGSIFSLLPAAAASADFLFFAAGSTPLAYGSTLNNDYLVWGVNVTAVPEPEIYAMMGIGLALMGFVARRRRQQGLT
ncbi:MAG TPA: PEP-CTERM sorting domain-containing protein [Burkholderiales bacterium]